MKRMISIVTSIIILPFMLATPAVAAEEDEIIGNSIISSTSYTAEEAGAIVPFDYEKTFDELYAHIQENNSDITPEQAYEIAQKLTDNIAAIENNIQTQSCSAQTLQADNTDNKVIIPLGRIVDGELSQTTTFAPIMDSYTRIVSEGWSVNPHIAQHTLWSNFLISWDSLDLYKSHVGGTYTQAVTKTTEKQIGFSSTGELSASDCAKFGLSVTASATVSSTLQKGFTINVDAWTKMCVRPYIYYYVDNYEGTYRYYCYRALDKEYFYIYENRTAENTYDIERSYRVWTRVNVNHDTSAVSPVPPSEWEW